MIDPAEYVLAKADNKVTLQYDGVSIITATIQQFDPLTGLPIASLTEQATAAEIAYQVQAATTILNNLQTLQTDSNNVIANVAKPV